ncbi:hypothetical protein Tco_0982992 [Tanacetum coccineum]
MAKNSQKWHNGTSRGRRSHYTKDCPQREEGKTLEEAYYTQFGGPFQRGGYRATAKGYYQRNNANPSYQERRQSMEDTLRKFMSESTKRHEENSNLIKEFQASTDVAIRNKGASIKNIEIQIGQMSKSISTTIEVDSHSIRRIGSSQYAVSTGLNSTLLYKSRQMMVPFLSHLDNHYCEEEEGNYGPKFTKAYGAAHVNNVIEECEIIEEFRTRDKDLDIGTNDYHSYCNTPIKSQRSEIPHWGATS